MKQGEPGVPEIRAYLKDRLEAAGGARVGFDGRVLSLHEAKKYLELPGVEIVWDLDLVDKIWPDRPQIKPSEIWELPLEVTGQTKDEKLAGIRAEMKNEGADYLLLSSLDEIAWTWNQRGDDVECNPVFFSYALISQTEANLYTMRDGTYEDVYRALAGIGANETLWLDGESASYALVQAAGQAKILDKHTPVQLMKAIKNPAEIASTTNAHIRDGAAMVNFLF